MVRYEIMSYLIENIKSRINNDFITLYDFVVNFAEYNNDSLENVGVFLSNIGFGRFDIIFGNPDYDIWLYKMGIDYSMHASTYIRDTHDPLPKIIKQIKNSHIDKDLTSQIFLRKSELLNAFNLNTMLDFLKQPIHATDTTTLQAQLDQANARIAELEQQLATQNSTPATMELSHTNTALTALFDVMNTHWQNPKTPPKQAFIQKWIVEKYPSIDPSKALWIDKIIRHQDQK